MCVTGPHTQPLCLNTQYWSPCGRVPSCVKTYTIDQTGHNSYAWFCICEQGFNLSCDSFSAFRQFVFAAFTKEFISAPFTEPIFHFFIPALSDARLTFPFEAFLSSLQATINSSALLHSQAPWVFYFVLSAGENRLGESHNSGVYAGVYLLYVWTSRSQLCVGRRVVRGRTPAVPSGSAGASTSAASVWEQQPDGSEQRLGGRWQYWHPVIAHAGQMQLNTATPQSDHRLTLYSELMLQLNSVLFLKGMSFSSRMTAESLCSWSQRSVSTSWTASTRPMPCSIWCGGTQPARRFSPWWRPSATRWWCNIASWCQKSGTKAEIWYQNCFFRSNFCTVSSKADALKHCPLLFDILTFKYLVEASPACRDGVYTPAWLKEKKRSLHFFAL